MEQISKIKPKALCIFKKDNQLLVAQYHHVKSKLPFYRPLGGSIDFGEHSRDTVIREIYEELDTEITAVKFLGIIENIYQYKGKTSHELLYIYSGKFVENFFYEQPVLEAYEKNRKFSVVWKPITHFLDGRATLYPEGLIDLLIEQDLISTPIERKILVQ